MRFKFVKPGQTFGMAFDGLVYINGKWCIFPKPYRIDATSLEPPKVIDSTKWTREVRNEEKGYSFKIADDWEAYSNRKAYGPVVNRFGSSVNVYVEETSDFTARMTTRMIPFTTELGRKGFQSVPKNASTILQKQYIFIDEKLAYILTFSASGNKAELEKLFGTMAGTFQLHKKK